MARQQRHGILDTDSPADGFTDHHGSDWLALRDLQ
jgi:hypothetical protein